MITRVSRLAPLLAAFALGTAHADEVQVAVAANFSAPMTPPRKNSKAKALPSRAHALPTRSAPWRCGRPKKAMWMPWATY
jgi:hypothetical protein